MTTELQVDAYLRASIPPELSPDISQPRPVFVVGSVRSGASLLALSLGQHPHLIQVLETNWFERLGMGLQRAFGMGIRPRNTSQLDVSGIEIDTFFAHFGAAADRLMRGQVDSPFDIEASIPPLDPDARASAHRFPSRARWIDASPANCYSIFVLLRLFPAARIIHVVRDVDEVIASLTNPALFALYRSRHLETTVAEACVHWLDVTKTCLAAEEAFGSATILRVRRDLLVADPGGTLEECLAFLGESFSAACLRPFSSIEPTTNITTPGGETSAERTASTPLYAEAKALWATIQSDARPDFPEDFAKAFALETAFMSRARRGLSAVPTTIPGYWDGTHAPVRRRGPLARSIRFAKRIGRRFERHAPAE